MKKHKSKSKHISASKKVRKELASKLTTAFDEVIAEFGSAKKTEKVIEKFAKQLVKKITLTTKEEVAPVKEEETEEVKPVATVKKAPAKKTEKTV